MLKQLQTVSEWENKHHLLSRCASLVPCESFPEQLEQMCEHIHASNSFTVKTLLPGEGDTLCVEVNCVWMCVQSVHFFMVPAGLCLCGYVSDVKRSGVYSNFLSVECVLGFASEVNRDKLKSHSPIVPVNFTATLKWFICLLLPIALKYWADEKF